jgi:predicted membrane channel-forming protein YqfA (hemolysin III family)
MWITILIFAVAAIVGITMAQAVFQGRLPPLASALTHGALAVTGLVLLIVAVCVHRVGGAARWALGFFLVAALGGLILAFAYHARKKNLPANFVVGHATLAVIGFLLLLAGALHLF